MKLFQVSSLTSLGSDTLAKFRIRFTSNQMFYLPGTHSHQLFPLSTKTVFFFLQKLTITKDTAPSEMESLPKKEKHILVFFLWFSDSESYNYSGRMIIVKRKIIGSFIIVLLLLLIATCIQQISKQKTMVRMKGWLNLVYSLGQALYP